MAHQHRRFVLLLSLAAAASLALVGCASERALHVVEDSGARAVWRGDWETAEREYREIVERRPGNWRARKELGRALLELDRPAEARENLEVVYTTQPEDPEVLELLVTAMLESGDADAMAAELQRRAEDSGEVPDWMRLGVFLQRAGDLDGAERSLLTAARIDQGASYQPQMALAAVYREAGDDDSAIRRLRMAHYRAPNNARVNEAIRSYGEIPGPTFARMPVEARPN